MDPCRLLAQVAGVRRRGAVALVLGSEGSGVRPDVRSAASRLVAIPIERTVESLNVAVAGSILMYALAVESADD